MKKVRTTDKRNLNAPRDLIRDPFTPAELAALADAATKRPAVPAKEKHD